MRLRVAPTESGRGRSFHRQTSGSEAEGNSASAWATLSGSNSTSRPTMGALGIAEGYHGMILRARNTHQLVDDGPPVDAPPHEEARKLVALRRQCPSEA